MKLNIKYNEIYLLSIIACIVLVNFGCVTQNSIAQSSENRVATHSSIKKNSDEAKIEVYQNDFVISDTNLNIILEAELPIIKLNFPCQCENEENTNNEDLFKLLVSNTDQNIFENYWKESLRYRYDTLFKRSEIDGKIYSEKSNIFLGTSNEFINTLQVIYINAPNGKRKISDEEAIEIMKGINLASSKVIKKLGETYP